MKALRYIKGKLPGLRPKGETMQIFLESLAVLQLVATSLYTTQSSANRRKLGLMEEDISFTNKRNYTGPKQSPVES